MARNDPRGVLHRSPPWAQSRAAQMENIDRVERSFTFVQDKTDVKIKVPIHPELLESFQSLKMPAARGKPIFPSLCHLPGPGRNGLSMRFKRLMKRAGIEDGTARERPGKRGHRIGRLSYPLFQTFSDFGACKCWRAGRVAQED